MITIRRPAQLAPGMRAYRVFVDGTHVGDIRAGEAPQFPVSPGAHTLQLRVGWCRSKTLELELAGEPLTFDCGSTARCDCAGEAVLRSRNYIWLRRVR